MSLSDLDCGPMNVITFHRGEQGEVITYLCRDCTVSNLRSILADLPENFPVCGSLVFLSDDEGAVALQLGGSLEEESVNEVVN
jgi:hypothetical protein